MSDQRLLRSYLEKGLQAHNLGNIEAAKDAFQRALAVAPDHPDALNFYGVTLLQLGQAASALDYLQRAAHLQRNNPAVVGNLAQAYFVLGRYDEAHMGFRKAGRLDPHAAQFPLGAANSLAMQGRFDAAEDLLQRLAVRFPQSALVWFNLGNVQRDRQRAPEALASFRKASALDPQLVDARNNLADVLHKLLRFEEAEREYRACIAAAPDYIVARCNLASVVMDLGRFSEAETLCREVISRAPQLALAHTFLGAALGHQGRLADALASYRTAMQLAPDDPKLAQTLGTTLVDIGHFTDGTRWLSRALAREPQMASTRLLLGYALLGHGCLAEGWAYYTSRPWPDMFRAKYPHTTLARTLPADLSGKRICVVREQGLGDEIFFLRYVPQLHAAGARVAYVAGNKIADVLAGVADIDQILDETAAPPATDAVMLVGDLPHALGCQPASALPSAEHPAPVGLRQFPERIGIFWPAVPPPLPLAPTAARVAELRQRLAALGNPPYIGLTWRGGTPPREQRLVIWALFKEIGIAPLAAALKDVPGTMIALQRNPAPGELSALTQALGREVHDFTAMNDDIDGMLALLAVLDEYVAVSNTNVHLRASVTRPSRVLVPCPAEWRWMQAGRSSPWFPGSIVYRQSAQGDWTTALRSLQQDLHAR